MSDEKPKPPRVWSCGWYVESGRCLRLDCRETGPCGGYRNTLTIAEVAVKSGRDAV